MINIDIKNAFYGEHQILDSISISIHKGERLVILGESGSGKSTLIKILGGLHKSYEGSLIMDDSPISPQSTRIGYMPQKTSLLPWFTVFENTIALRKTKDRNFNKNEALELLNSLNILKLKDKYPNQISGGEAQRASLASVIFFKPELILMDEPFSALDEVTRNEMQLLFLEQQERYNFTTIFVTHSIEEALLIGRKIVVMNKLSKTMSYTFENNTTPYSKEFYAQMDMLRGVIKSAKENCI